VPRKETERAIKATLETLKQRLSGNKPDNLAAQFPEDLANPLRGQGGREDFALAGSTGGSPRRRVSTNLKPPATPGP
jgi:uncharacterized protein (DUF2267 family)